MTTAGAGRGRRFRHARTARPVVAAALAAALLAACTTTSAPGPEDVGTDGTALPTYQDDPSQITQLREAAGLAECPEPGIDVGAGQADDPLPALTLDCLGDGPAVNLAELGGVPYIVNVWAGWCAPCRAEMPLLQEVYEQAAGEVGVIGIDFQDTTVAGLSAAAEFGVTFPSVQDSNGDTRAKLRFAGMPFTAFVAADGEIIARKTGEIRSAAELRSLVAEHLGVTL